MQLIVRSSNWFTVITNPDSKNLVIGNLVIIAGEGLYVDERIQILFISGQPAKFCPCENCGPSLQSATSTLVAPGDAAADGPFFIYLYRLAVVRLFTLDAR